MRALTLILAVVVCNFAHAGGYKADADANAAAYANAKSKARAESAAVAQQQQAQQQANQQTAHTGDVSVSLENETRVNTKHKRQAPPVYAPNINPTSPCIVTGGAGLSVPGGGVSLGGGKRDHECTLRETARMFAEIGQRGFALQLLCSSNAVERAGLVDLCPKTDSPPEPEQVHVTVDVNQPCCDGPPPGQPPKPPRPCHGKMECGGIGPPPHPDDL